jgi:hypothetical protein
MFVDLQAIRMYAAAVNVTAPPTVHQKRVRPMAVGFGSL